VLATIVATPCSAPFLAPALGAALALSTVQSFAIFTAIAIGLAAPYLLLSIFPGAVKVLPAPACGWKRSSTHGVPALRHGRVPRVGAGRADRRRGFSIRAVRSRARRDGRLGLRPLDRAGRVAGPRALRRRRPGRARRRGPLARLAAKRRGQGASALAAGVPEIAWKSGAPRPSEIARGEPLIYVDFTARWCATCQANKKLVFHSDEVLKAFAGKKIATLRGDWTNRDPAITAELAKYHRSAVPFNQLWLPGKMSPSPSELLTPGVVLAAVNGK